MEMKKLHRWKYFGCVGSEKFYFSFAAKVSFFSLSSVHIAFCTCTLLTHQLYPFSFSFGLCAILHKYFYVDVQVKNLWKLIEFLFFFVLRSSVFIFFSSYFPFASYFPFFYRFIFIFDSFLSLLSILRLIFFPALPMQYSFTMFLWKIPERNYEYFTDLFEAAKVREKVSSIQSLNTYKHAKLAFSPYPVAIVRLMGHLMNTIHFFLCDNETCLNWLYFGWWKRDREKEKNYK